MKAIATILVSSALLLAAAGPSWASDQTRFAALIRKFLPDYTAQYGTFAPKTLCVCEPGVKNTAGALVIDQDFIGCVVPVFTNGTLSAFQHCASYAVLGK